MNISFYRLALVALCAFTVLPGCATSEEKLENARTNVDEANASLHEAELAYQEDVAQYRKLSNENIAANNKRIADFNNRIAKDKQKTTAEYNAEMKDLSRKNSDLQHKIDKYQLSTRDNWETFKMEFNREMDEINASLAKMSAPKND